MRCWCRLCFVWVWNACFGVCCWQLTCLEVISLTSPTIEWLVWFMLWVLHLMRCVLCLWDIWNLFQSYRWIRSCMIVYNSIFLFQRWCCFCCPRKIAWSVWNGCPCAYCTYLLLFDQWIGFCWWWRSRLRQRFNNLAFCYKMLEEF